MAWTVDMRWWARTIRSLRWVLKGRVFLWVTRETTVVVWRPRRYWQRDCQLVFPTGVWDIDEQAFVEGWIVSLLRKISEVDRRKLTAPAVSDPDLDRAYPGLHEYLTAARYVDGTPRQVSTLLIFVSEGQWKGMLRDKDNARCLWATASSYDQVLEVLEALLQAPEAPWRADRSAEQPEATRLNGKRPGQRKKK